MVRLLLQSWVGRVGFGAAALFTLAGLPGWAIAGQIEKVIPDYIQVIPEHEHDKGYVVHGVKAAYPGGSWITKTAKAGLATQPVTISIYLLTPRGRVVHEVVSRIRTRGYAITGDLNPETFNNGFLVAATHSFPSWQKSEEWLEFTGVQCRTKDGQLTDPIRFEVDSIRVDVHGNNERYSQIEAIFPLSLIESDEALDIVFHFKRHKSRAVRFAASTVRGLR